MEQPDSQITEQMPGGFGITANGAIPTAFAILSAVNHPPILLGTSSFTASGWNGSFYPRGMKPSDYLRFYAERFHTVEVDSAFYACPTARTVENWNARTPDGFVFSVKVPQAITHDKVLVDCDAEIAEFLEVMDILAIPFFFQCLPETAAFLHATHVIRSQITIWYLLGGKMLNAIVYDTDQQLGSSFRLKRLSTFI